MTLDWTVIIAAIISVGGAVYAGWQNRGKNKADAASVLTGAALKMVDEVQEQLNAARAAIDNLNQRQHEQSTLILSLRDRIRSLERENEALQRRIKIVEQENAHLKIENAHLREEFEKATGNKPDTGPLKETK